MAIAAAAATALFVAATLGDQIDAAIRSHNNKKARKLQKQLDQLTKQYNLTRSQLDSALAKHNLKYDNLMRNLEYSSPAGTAHTVLEGAIKKNREIQQEYQNKMNQNESNYQNSANYLNQQIAKKQDRGLIDVLGGVINGKEI